MSSSRFPTAHPWRDRLVRELHARPSEPIQAPVSVSRLVMVVGEGGADEARAYLSQLCARKGVVEPAVTASFHAADLGNVRLRWERHTELVTYQVVRPLDPARAPFEQLAPDGLPEDWLAGIPGELLIGMHAEVRAQAGSMRDLARNAFGDVGYAAALAGDGAVWVASDFRMHGDGFERLLLATAPEASALAAGRVMQALFEINTYRMAALLGFPTALETRGKLGELEAELAATMQRFEASADHAADREVLDRLTSLSARAEALANSTNYRFAASGAYDRLVGERIDALVERPTPEGPTLGTFLRRRLAPAMRTCDAVQARQEALLERIARATRLLATRVQVTTEEQNAGLLESMNSRARTQLRLQQTVEGLSVVALSYYVLGIAGYIFKGMYETGWAVDPSVAVAVVAAPTIAGVWWFLQRVKERLGAD